MLDDKTVRTFAIRCLEAGKLHDFTNPGLTALAETLRSFEAEVIAAIQAASAAIVTETPIVEATVEQIVTPKARKGAAAK